MVFSVKSQLFSLEISWRLPKSSEVFEKWDGHKAASSEASGEEPSPRIFYWRFYTEKIVPKNLHRRICTKELAWRNLHRIACTEQPTDSVIQTLYPHQRAFTDLMKNRVWLGGTNLSKIHLYSFLIFYEMRIMWESSEVMRIQTACYIVSGYAPSRLVCYILVCTH